MRYAICNELYQDWSFEQAFEHAASLGYQGIEIAPFTLGDSASSVSAATRRHVVELAQKHSLEIVGLHWLLAKTEGLHITSPDTEIRQRTARYLVDLVDLCGDLNGRVMVFGSPQQRNLKDGVSYEQGVAFFQDVLRQVIPALRSRNVVLALEPLGPEEGNFMTTAHSAIEIIDNLKSDHVRLHLDVKAMSTEPDPIPTIIKRSKNYVAHFHANDPNRRGPGMGEIDFSPIFAALRQIEYDGWVSVEVFDYEPGIQNLAQKSIEYMQSVAAASH